MYILLIFLFCKLKINDLNNHTLLFYWWHIFVWIKKSNQSIFTVIAIIRIKLALYSFNCSLYAVTYNNKGSLNLFKLNESSKYFESQFCRHVKWFTVSKHILYSTLCQCSHCFLLFFLFSFYLSVQRSTLTPHFFSIIRSKYNIESTCIPDSN